MALRLNRYQEQPGAILETNRLEVGKTLQRLLEKKGLPFFVRDIQTNAVTEVITEPAAPAFDAELRRAFHLENFVGIVEVPEEQESIDGRD